MDEIKIESHRDLERVTDEFVAGTLENVMVVGSPGTMKTTTVCRRITAPFIRQSGQVSPFELYVDLYLQRDQLLVLDDVEDFLARTAGQELVRTLTESGDTKEIQWRTRGMIKAGVPSSFRTATRCLVIANRIGNTGIWEAMRSRCHVFRYEPSWEEFLFTVEEHGIFQDQEILAFAYANRHRIGRPDLRRLNKALALKNSSLSHCWKQSLGEPVEESTQWEVNAAKKRKKVADLLEDPTFASMDDRVKVFVKEGFGVRSTFFEYLKQVRQGGPSCRLKAAG